MILCETAASDTSLSACAHTHINSNVWGGRGGLLSNCPSSVQPAAHINQRIMGKIICHTNIFNLFSSRRRDKSCFRTQTGIGVMSHTANANGPVLNTESPSVLSALLSPFLRCSSACSAAQLPAVCVCVCVTLARVTQTQDVDTSTPCSPLTVGVRSLI